jgi:hypothetical protein
MGANTVFQEEFNSLYIQVLVFWTTTQRTDVHDTNFSEGLTTTNLQIRLSEAFPTHNGLKQRAVSSP